MTIHLIEADQEASIDATTPSGDIWIVEAGAYVTTAGDAIDGTGPNGAKSFLIHGRLVAEDIGIHLGSEINHVGGGNLVHILPTGSIFADSNAIESYGDSLVLTNEGSLFSRATTILAYGNNSTIVNVGTMYSYENNIIIIHGSDNTINNEGEIVSFSGSIIITGDFNKMNNSGLITSVDSSCMIAFDNHNTISNSGDIVATLRGIYVSGADNMIVNSGKIVTSVTWPAVMIGSHAGESNSFFNSGEIDSKSVAVLGGDGSETVVNRGTMFGDVDLGLGADLFKGWYGSVEGEIHGGGGKDTLIGGASDDAIFGDLGADVLKGGGGDDTLAGGGGRDIMRGGLGCDTFDFNAPAESATWAHRDQILDFTKGEDVIDVSTIDAKAGVAGNQAFDFIGAAHFSGTEGELRAKTTPTGDTIVAADLDGDAKADFMILVADAINLDAGDFIV